MKVEDKQVRRLFASEAQALRAGRASDHLMAFAGEMRGQAVAYGAIGLSKQNSGHGSTSSGRMGRSVFEVGGFHLLQHDLQALPGILEAHKLLPQFSAECLHGHIEHVVRDVD